MLKKETQLTLNLSDHSELYNILIAKNNILRQINEMVDFSFIYEELKNNYSDGMGRPGEDPIRMFKYLLLKSISKLSDRDLVERVRTDMAYKYFLGYNPEDVDLIDPSLLTVFRRQRLKDIHMLDLLINKTVEIAIEKGVVNIKNKIIVDSTHTNALYQHISPREALIRQAKLVRKTVYEFDETMKEKMPKKKESSGILEDQMEYTKQLLSVLEKEESLNRIPKINEQKNVLEEMLNDTTYELEYSKDKDAKIGHKSADTSFFGYKTHLAMTPERIITAATITSGEKHDGKELTALIEKSEVSGIEIEAVIGDKAYSEKDNIEYCENKKIELASKLSKVVTHGVGKNKEDFTYNKDAGMYVCKAGHMAIRKAKQGSRENKARR